MTVVARRSDRVARGLETVSLGCLVVIVLGSLAVHVRFREHAGALWRDEANSAQLATATPLSHLYWNLDYDSFPAAWPLILKAFTAIFGGDDATLRTGGTVVGMMILVALIAAARVARSSPPVLAVALIGLAPTVVIFGDSIRAYGLGITCLIMVAGSAYRFSVTGERRFFALFVGSSILAAHLLYHSSVLIFAMTIAAMVTALPEWRRCAALFAGGFATAATLLLYVPVLRQIRSWAIVHAAGLGGSWYVQELRTTLDASFAGTGEWLVMAWALTCVFAGAMVMMRREKTPRCIVFGLIFLLLAPVCYLGFLTRVGYVSATWYYLPLIVLSIAVTDLMFASRCCAPLIFARSSIALLIAALLFPHAWNDVRMRMSNIDIAAATIEERSPPDTFVVVDPWNLGVSFVRYASPKTEWETLPPLNKPRAHVYARLLDIAARDDGARRLAARARAVLDRGGEVWVICAARYPDLLAQTHVRTIAPIGALENRWRAIFADALRGAVHREEPLPSDVPVSKFENIHVGRYAK